MKILQITYSLASGGAERLVIDLVNILSQNNEIHLLVLLDDRSNENGFYKNLLSKNVHYHCAREKSGMSLRKILRMNKIVFNIDADVVHFHGFGIIYHFILSLAFNRKPVYIETLHTAANVIFGKWYSIIALTFFRMNLMKMVTISHENKLSVERTCNFYNSTLIYNGRSNPIQSKLFEKVKEEINNYKKNIDDLVFIHVGRFVYAKNQKVLIESFNELYKKNDNFILLIFGEGFDSVKGRELRGLSNPNIHYLGTKLNIIDYFLCADAFCLTSVHEGMPISLIESLACECVPICTPTSGVLDVLVDGKTGFVSEDFSTFSYVKKIEEFIDCHLNLDKSLLKQTYLEHFSIYECSKSYNDLYLNLLKSKKTSYLLRIYERVILSSYSFFKHDSREKYYRKLLSNLDLSRNDLILMQNRDIQNLINHAYNHTQYYKEIMDSRGIKPEDINNKEDLMKLPTLTKQLIKNNILKLTSDDKFGKKMIKITSSGSTGEQGLIYRSNLFDGMSRASWLRNNSLIGWYPLDKTVWIWTSPLKDNSFYLRSKARIRSFFNRQLYLDSFNYSDSDFPIWHDKIINFKPKILYGNSSVILEFANFLLDNKLSLVSIKIVVCTTEKLRKRNIISKAFNCQVYDQYGSSEVIAIGIEVGKDEMIFTDDVVIVNSNENNEFLLTPLFSYGFPLINYRLGDTLDSKNVNRISELFPFPVMSLEIGRTTDKFLTEGDRKISSTSLGSYMAKFELDIVEHKIVQSDYKEFKIFFVTNKQGENESYKLIVNRCLEQQFGSNLRILFKKVRKIPLERSGKKLMFKRTFKIEI